jgi:AdoMet-dependent rRNA methyltransferase SPB1
MVCLGYKAPDYIDPKFLDPKHVFEDIEAREGGVDGNEKDPSAKIASLKRLLQDKRPNRSGYLTERGILFEECDLKDFLDSADPYEFLSKFHKVRQ